MGSLEGSSEYRNLPSGYEYVEQLPEPLHVSDAVLPWLDGGVDLSVVHCMLDGGDDFYFTSAIGTHDKLIEAAASMSEAQRRITDQMLYSRLPGLVVQGCSPHILTLDSPVTPSAIRIMRNPGGQRVYLTRPTLSLECAETSEPVPVYIRLGVCDIKEQAAVLGVLSTQSLRNQRNLRKK
ncbi:MAG TPA: hypothetical protein VJP80_07775 [Candidatus Saccharimonadales bacterium]|nr:hypothetical protein [Candidatus Saccharimonadales bacterium]